MELGKLGDAERQLLRCSMTLLDSVSDSPPLQDLNWKAQVSKEKHEAERIHDIREHEAADRRHARQLERETLAAQAAALASRKAAQRELGPTPHHALPVYQQRTRMGPAGALIPVEPVSPPPRAGGDTFRSAGSWTARSSQASLSTRYSARSGLVAGSSKSSHASMLSSRRASTLPPGSVDGAIDVLSPSARGGLPDDLSTARLRSARQSSRGGGDTTRRSQRLTSRLSARSSQSRTQEELEVLEQRVALERAKHQAAMRRAEELRRAIKEYNNAMPRGRGYM